MRPRLRFPEEGRVSHFDKEVSDRRQNTYGCVGWVINTLDGCGISGGLKIRGKAGSDDSAQGSRFGGATGEDERHLLATSIIYDIVGAARAASAAAR